jgi:hypothetical protein
VLPHAPGAIDSNSIEVVALEEEDKALIRLNVSWEEPEKAYGMIEMYQVRMLQKKVLAGSEDLDALVVAQWMVSMPRK